MQGSISEKIYAIILAGGSGSRMGADKPKQYLELAGKPVLAHSMIAFEKSEADRIYIVCDPSYEEYIKKNIIDIYGITKFAGFAMNGTERVESVKNGINAALEEIQNEEYKNIYLMIHDGARPLISQELISRCISSVKKNKAVIPVLPLKDTIKKISGEVVELTPDRNDFCAVQTPQCFRADVIYNAYETFEQSEAEGFVPTDDASLVEMFTDVNVVTVQGEEVNLKLTTPVDMKVAELFCHPDEQKCMSS